MIVESIAKKLVVPALSVTGQIPFQMRRLDHIVLRCNDAQKMLDFYAGVLGAEPTTLANGDSSVGRFGGCLTHLRIGSSLIDLTSYDAPIGRKLHGGGTGLAEDDLLPVIDGVANGTLDHFAINVEPYDPDDVREYLTEKGHKPFSEGERYGADGDGYSMYLYDPENNVVELKCGASVDTNIQSDP